MGGASTALFDAGSSLENPASIAGARRSFTVEARNESVDRRFIDSVDDGISTTSMHDSRQHLSRLTFTRPFANGTISLFYDEPLNARSDTRPLFTGPGVLVPIVIDGGTIVGGPHNREKHVCQQCSGLQVPLPVALNADANLRLRKYGAASAWTYRAIAFGASLQYHRLDQHTTTIASTNFNPNEESHDHSFAYSAGAIWTVTDRTRLAASYSSAASFTSTRFGAIVILPAQRAFRTPATLRSGIAVDLTPRVTFTADAVHVAYHVMTNRVSSDADRSYHSASYHNAVELHAGTEWRVSPALALRTGFWRDPAHHLQARNYQAYFTWPEIVGIQQKNEKHFTTGATIGQGRARINAAFDHGATTTTSSVGVETTF